MSSLVFNTFCEKIGAPVADDSQDATLIIRQADHMAQNRELLPKAIMLYEAALMVARTKESVERAAEEIVKHVENMPDHLDVILALAFTAYRVSLNSKCEQPAIDKLTEAVKKDPEVLDLIKDPEIRSQKEFWKNIFHPAELAP